MNRSEDYGVDDIPMKKYKFIKSIYTGDHVIIQLQTKHRELLSSVGAMDSYLRKVTAVAEMTPLTAPAVFEVPFANELGKYTVELEEELKKLGITLKTVDKMRDRITARDNKDSGCTGVSVWAESHSAAHGWTEQEFITIDLYSCKDFDIQKVIDFTSKYWKAFFLVYKVIHRYTDKNIEEDDVKLYF